jgi:archaemetzincin
MEILLESLESPEGEPPAELMEEIRQALEDVFVARVAAAVRGPRVPEPSFDAARRQYNAPLILQKLLERPPGAGRKLLAVTRADLFIPMLSFVYGLAQLGGQAAVVSLARLDQKYYGLPENDALLSGRARKEAVHETGHLFGLVHCEQPECAMRLSTNIRQLDLKGDALCAGCAALARESA